MRPDWSAYRRFVFGRPLVIEDLLHENRFKAPRALLAQGAISGLVAPLLCVTRPSGLIAAFSTDQRKFSPTDVAFFKAAANLLNAVLENDRLRSQLQLSATSVRRETTRKTSFVANASHEIRSPLNVILGYCEIIGECLRDTGDTNVTAWMEAVERAGTRLLATVDDILDYSRIEAGTVPLAVESLRLAPLVQAVARAAAPAAIAKRIGLSCAIDAPDAVVRGDRRCLTVALTKLVANAIKFTARGAVEIGLKRDRRGRVILEIRDTGVGIAADYIPRLFEPFSQEVADYARPFEGIGLGLAIARHYLQLNHAHISARSEKGRGSVFTVRLPVVAAKLSGKPSGPPMRLCQTRPQPLISGCTSR